MTTIERFESAAASGLVWLPERGMGFYRPALRMRTQLYDRPYWDKYVSYAEGAIGAAITAYRCELVAAFHATTVVDIGIGCGEFISARARQLRATEDLVGATLGYDVNPVAVKWLGDRGLWADPYSVPFPSATFWDAIEHIENPSLIIRNVQELVFATLPIFRDADHVLRSKHFKPEHIWYWTESGFVRWMEEHGFALECHETYESYLGREDSHTFVFRRREAVRAAAA